MGSGAGIRTGVCEASTLATRLLRQTHAPYILKDIFSVNTSSLCKIMAPAWMFPKIPGLKWNPHDYDMQGPLGNGGHEALMKELAPCKGA